MNFFKKKKKFTSGILYNSNKMPVRELFVIIRKENPHQNENQSTASFTENVLHKKKSAELNSCA